MKEAVAGLSHDLRTPLTALIGYLDLLEQEENGETVRRYLSQIRNRTEALKDLTEELFQYSVAASSQELHPEPVDVVGSLEETEMSVLVSDVRMSWNAFAISSADLCRK